MARFIEPMLARSGAVPGGDDWALEVKFDGMRAQLRWDRRFLCLRSRPGRDCTGEFPELAAIRETLGERLAILDGELVCFADDGNPDFERLRGRLQSNGGRRPDFKQGARHLPRLRPPAPRRTLDPRNAVLGSAQATGGVRTRGAGLADAAS